MAATTLKEAVIQALNKAANAFYSPQTLTPEQQEQARTNIGAMSAATSPSVPAGTLLPFAGTAVPDGYLLCNGAEVSRTDYANLFAAIGTKWGEGDGSTTFTLPNFNDRFIEGTTDTEKVGQYLEAGAPNISGSFSLPGTEAPSKASHTGVFTVPGNTTGDYALGHASGGGNPIVYLDSSLVSTVYREVSEIRPNSSYCLMIIKV